MVNVVPVDVSKEGMRHDLLCIRRARSESQLRLAGEQLLEDRDRVARHVDRVKGFVGKNSIVNFVLVFSTERRLLEKHLVDQDTKCPPINSTTVLLVKQDLHVVSIITWCQVCLGTYLGRHELWSTTECAGSRSVPHFLLAQTVIGNLDVSIQCEQDVVELQITVDDTIFVEILERKTDLCCVEPRGVLAVMKTNDESGKLQGNLLSALSTKLTPLNVQHQITTTDVLHHEVNSGLRLETSVQTKQEGMSLLVSDQENSLFRASALDFIVLDNELFLQDLDGVQLLRALGLSKHDLSEVTLSKNSEEVEVVQAYSSPSPLRVSRRCHLVLRCLSQG